MTSAPTITIPDAVAKLLAIVEELRRAHPVKRFTLDGRLVGDIGEVLVASAYDVTLHEKVEHHHDAIDGQGRRVQIKATMQSALTFPASHTPDYYIGIKIERDGTFTEIFNGRGELAREAIANRAHPRTNLHSVGLRALERLSLRVPPEDRIRRRDVTATPLG
jgi:hypothetical protein